MAEYQEIRRLIGEHLMEEAFAEMRKLFYDKPGLKIEINILQERFQRNRKEIGKQTDDHPSSQEEQIAILDEKGFIIASTINLLETGLIPAPSPTEDIPPVLGSLPPGLQNFIGRDKDIA